MNPLNEDAAGMGVPATGATAVRSPLEPQKRTHLRWVVCGLLLFATTVNYLDRQVLGLLAPHLTQRFHWTEEQYSYIVTSFQLAYLIGLLVVGRILDAIGTRLGYGLAAFVWSIASIAHAYVGSWISFSVARFALGLSEAANFPAAVKVTAEWFPKKERALATGIFNAGSNIGIVVAAIFVPIIGHHWGWRHAFFLSGIPGLLWCIVWLIIYRRPRQSKRISQSELEYIESDPADPPMKIRWISLLPHRQTWVFAVGKFLTDPVWWFFLFWLPKYFHTTYGVNLTGLVLPMVIIYVAADVGSIGGGWISSRMLAKGFTINASRKTAMLICAICVAPMIFASYVHNMWVTVALVSLAAAAHQGWSANLYTLVSDCFPRSAVGSVVGLGSMFGALSGMIASLTIGWVLERMNHNYAIILTVAGFMYLIALFIIHLLSPRLRPVELALPAAGQQQQG